MDPSVENVEDVPPSEPAQKLPWYKRPATKYVILRVVMRICSIAAMVVILKLFGSTLKEWGAAYLLWIRTLGVVGGPVVFLVIATVFSGISPTGYIPSVAAGATFPYEVSIPISYALTVLGALFNLCLVRVVIRRLTCFDKLECCRRCQSKKKNRRQAWVDSIIQALLTHPVRMTTLVRLPFLGNGSLNWVLSRSELPAGPMMLGNCIGMLPGAIVFAVLGTQIRSLAGMIAEEKAEPTAIAVMVTLFVVCSLSLLGVILTTKRVMAKQGLVTTTTPVSPPSPAEASRQSAGENYTKEAA